MTAVTEVETVESKPEPKEATPTPTPESIHEQIAALAYALWQERGCPEGSPDVDWFQAEAVLTTKK